MSESTHPIVILGAGHAGTTVAALLRQAGWQGELVLVERSTDVPYHRPPLSKRLLQETEPEPLKPIEFFAEQAIDLRLGITVERIDREAGVLHLVGGDVLPYGQLVIATGARARNLPLPGMDLDGVHTLRELTDASNLRASLAGAAKLVVVGGGFIGLEAAASARTTGLEVHVLESRQRLLNGSASSALAARLADVHRSRGVEISYESTLRGFQGRGRVSGVMLEDGGVIPADAVLIGVGCTPDTELAEAAGLDCADGIVVDHRCRTSDPRILALGDVAVRPMNDGVPRRIESIPNATAQARQVCATLTGAPDTEPEVPWFWSDQYDQSVKIAGLPPHPINTDLDAHVVERTSDDGVATTWWHFRGTELTCVESLNNAPEFMAGRKFLSNGDALDQVALAAGAPMRQVRRARMATTGIEVSA